ncbi:MAG TPA: hypothetical protein ENK86_01975, partial [Campylobacterales bacterium]|nr:hypothetical protein [Campylobacterales bacterium]
MGISNKLNSILQNPLIDTIANTIKKFKSSKSYWSVSYLILLFTIREAVAWKFGSAIEHFFQKQAEGSEYPWVWDTLGFVFGVGGSIELVILGVVLFIILSSVKLFESKTTPETNDKIEEEHDKTRDTITQENQKLKDELLRELNIYGNKEKFLQEYFGDDWQQAIENPQTYHSLKQQ